MSGRSCRRRYHVFLVSVAVFAGDCGHSYAVADSGIVLINDLINGGYLTTGHNNALCNAALEYHVKHPAALFLFGAVCFDGQAGGKFTLHIGIAIYGLQNIGVQSLDQSKLEVVGLLILVVKNFVTTPRLDSSIP